MSALRGVAVRVLLEGTRASGESKRYRLDWDTAARTSKLVIFSGDKQEDLTGALGLVDLQTSETMTDQGAALVLKVGRLGQRLIELVECQDRLRIEIRASDEKTLSVAFDGFIESPSWTESSTPQAVSYSLSLQARGVIKFFTQQWLNWQGMLRASDSMSLGNLGIGIYTKLCQEGQSAEPTELIKILVQEGADKIIDLQAGDTPVKSGEFFQIAEGTNWQTAFNLRNANSRTWFYNSQGTFWGIMAGLAEMDFHEFFWTYDFKNGGGADAQEIPTLVFRPRPFPGAEGDDDNWNKLASYPVVVGDPGDGTGCRHVSSSKMAASVSNAFTLAFASADMGGVSDWATKIRIGFYADRPSIKRFGFGVRLVTTSLIGSDGATFWGETGPKILKRVAWQDAPLPYLPNQTRAYPLLAGVHVGEVLEDHTAGKEVCGYVVSVTHKVTTTNNAISLGTILGVTRCLPKSSKFDGTSEAYPDAVRKFAHVEREIYIEPPHMESCHKESGANGGQSQPALNDTTVVQTWTASATAKARGIDNTPNSAQKAALARLQALAVGPIKAALGDIKINSMFRNAAVNNATPGHSNTSQHMDGNAFDFDPPPGTSFRQAYDTLYAMRGSIPFKQVLWEHHPNGVQHIHVGLYPDGQVGDPSFNPNYQASG